MGGLKIATVAALATLCSITMTSATAASKPLSLHVSKVRHPCGNLDRVSANLSLHHLHKHAKYYVQASSAGSVGHITFTAKRTTFRHRKVFVFQGGNPQPTKTQVEFDVDVYHHGDLYQALAYPVTATMPACTK